MCGRPPAEPGAFISLEPMKAIVLLNEKSGTCAAGESSALIQTIRDALAAVGVEADVRCVAGEDLAREAKAATGNELFLPPNASASGKAASRFAPPNWNDLRGLTPEERRLVLDYFKRINAEKP